MQPMYTRERKHIGIKWSWVTCLALPLAAAQSLGSQVIEDSQSRWRGDVGRDEMSVSSHATDDAVEAC
jgi:hypothetical protein